MNLDFSAVKNQKNLLAFSAGIDSSALFFLLLEQNIPLILQLSIIIKESKVKKKFLMQKNLQLNTQRIFILKI